MDIAWLWIMIKAIIFDYGWVLMRTEDLAPRRKWEVRLGMPEWRLADVVFDNPISERATIGLSDVDDVWQHVSELLNLEPHELVELRKDFWSGDRLDKVLTDFVTSQRPYCHTAVLSNAWPGTRQIFENHPELKEAFETWIISSEEGVAKPDPEIYERALRQLGVHAEEAAFVDDTTANVVAARRLGIMGVEFQTTDQALHELEMLI